MTVRDCDQNLSDRLNAGESLSRELGIKTETGREVLSQLTKIALAARGGSEPVVPKAPAHDAQAMAQAASAFAARARQRLNQAA
jgi:hypothetical protein